MTDNLHEIDAVEHSHCSYPTPSHDDAVKADDAELIVSYYLLRGQLLSANIPRKTSHKAAFYLTQKDSQCWS